ncbi:DNA phosphorothioation system sulfurtransferase DndC [Fodinibius sp. AD559]|uniref:DNA phosphorothioation system sulfurtransferase DndC n=1 Tax=Fodinibius sp. AD559 TaxID=3424179 RepID=UPI004046B2E9
MESIFDEYTLEDIHSEIQDVYKNYSYPWVIGYSGGKDSTATLQLIWYAISELPEEERDKPIYVISTDTLVETPVIVDHVNTNLRLINQEAQKQNLPFEAHKLEPNLEDSFWVNLIGRGYPAPNNMFRWCTDRLKIKPSNQFILDKADEHGEVILALGTRRGESATRDQIMNKYINRGHKLSSHGQLPGAWVYPPIEYFTVDDVWQYLMQVESPWGAENRDLSSMYRSASADECPLVIDDSTPSCGNSRFGCWVCTVVSRDKSMESMIDSDSEEHGWMTPLLNFRDWLAETQNPENKSEQREFRGRDGRIKISENGRLRYRTYTLEFSKKILQKLLNTQKKIWNDLPEDREKSELEIIKIAELKEIRRLWITERQDWQDSVPEIYEETMGEVGADINWGKNDVITPGASEVSLLKELAKEKDLPLDLIQKLFDAELVHKGMKRRHNIHKKIAEVFREDWRSFDEVKEEMKRRQNKSEEESLKEAS